MVSSFFSAFSHGFVRMCIFCKFSIRFKDTIGEMKYVLKGPEFMLAMTMLAGMVPFESNLDYLDVNLRKTSTNLISFSLFLEFNWIFFMCL